MVPVLEGGRIIEKNFNPKSVFAPSHTFRFRLGSYVFPVAKIHDLLNLIKKKKI